MKRNYSGKKWLMLVMCVVVLSCGERAEVVVTEHEHNTQARYTCPMHPEIIRDAPGKCPICGMDLVLMNRTNQQNPDSGLAHLLQPVNEQVVASIPTITADDGSRIFSVPVQGVVSYDTRKQVSISSRVAGRIERMYIKYNFQPVSKGQVIMEIYSPDLAEAQRELIYISRNDPQSTLLSKARQRLALLGMPPGQIAQVEKSGKTLYRVPVLSTTSGYIIERSLSSRTAATPTGMPTASTSSSTGMNGGMAGGNQVASRVTQPAFNTSPVIIREGQYVGAGETVFIIYGANSMVAEFSFPPSLAAEIRVGQKLVFRTTAQPDDVRTGSVGLIEPVQKNGESFTVARVYIPNSGLQPGQLLVAHIPVVKKGTYWLPENAVWQLGKKWIVFKKEDRVFVPKEVKTGIRTEGLVQILDSIRGWQVAKNASFLVDSESFIRLPSNGQK